MSAKRKGFNAALAVVLGGGLKTDGTPNEATTLRAEAGARLAQAHPEMMFILSGGSAASDNVVNGACEAEIMARVFDAHGISRDRLLFEDQSRDTAGNAILVCARYLRHLVPQRLIIVTSPFHAERALLVFSYVLGSQWQLEVHGSAVAADDAVRGANESGGIGWTHGFFAELVPGHLPAIIQRLFERRPDYRVHNWLMALIGDQAETGFVADLQNAA
jgi:hypothetical protein